MLDEIAISGPTLAAFLIASLVLAITPGPAVIYLLTRTLAQGRRAGLASVVGVALGNFGNAAGAAVGLAALFAVSSAAFTVVKLAGAAYLIYLGIRVLRARPADTAPRQLETVRLGRLFRDGFFVALLNPKTALFFAAFLPQFIDPVGSAIAQSLAFGAAFVVIAATTDVIYVLAASTAARSLSGLRRGRAIGRYAAAGAFIGLGVLTATSGSRAAK